MAKAKVVDGVRGNTLAYEYRRMRSPWGGIGLAFKLALSIVTLVVCMLAVYVVVGLTLDSMFGTL